MVEKRPWPVFDVVVGGETVVTVHETDEPDPRLEDIRVPYHDTLRLVMQFLEEEQKKTYPHWECLIYDGGEVRWTIRFKGVGFKEEGGVLKYYFAPNK